MPSAIPSDVPQVARYQLQVMYLVIIKLSCDVPSASDAPSDDQSSEVAVPYQVQYQVMPKVCNKICLLLNICFFL